MNTESKTATSTTSSYTNYCYNRLPCGMCRITMRQCPLIYPHTVYPYQVMCGEATGWPSGVGGTYCGSDSITSKSYPGTYTIEIHNSRDAFKQ